MPFVRDVANAIATLPRNDPTRLTLEFLIANAVGHTNAVPIGDIMAHLRANGVVVSEQVWQHNVLQGTRAGTIFIGSSNHGYYLIDDRSDYVAMRDWYTNRMRAEARNLRNLARQAKTEGWQP